MANCGMSLEVQVEILKRENQEIKRENQEMERNFAESERKNKEEKEEMKRTIAEIQRKMEEEEGNTFGVFIFILFFIFSSDLRFNESLFLKYRSQFWEFASRLLCLSLHTNQKEALKMSIGTSSTKEAPSSMALSSPTIPTASLRRRLAASTPNPSSI
jgi:hypothetical protein